MGVFPANPRPALDDCPHLPDPSYGEDHPEIPGALPGRGPAPSMLSTAEVNGIRVRNRPKVAINPVDFDPVNQWTRPPRDRVRMEIRVLMVTPDPSEYGTGRKPRRRADFRGPAPDLHGHGPARIPAGADRWNAPLATGLWAI